MVKMMKEIPFLVGLLFFVSLTAHGQITKGVKEVTDSVKSGVSSVKSGHVKTAVSSVKGAFSAKAPSAQFLIGTWFYAEPAVLTTSGNLLIKAAGETAEGKLEKMLGEYYEKSNITSKNTYVTFNQDGTFVRTVAGHTEKGTWMVGGHTLYFATKNEVFSIMTTQVEDGGKLVLVTDVARVLDGIKKLGGLKDNTTNKAIVTLSKQVDGIEGGFLLTKKR